MSAQSATLAFRIDDPASVGHFPGNPIIPGAVLLREVVRTVTAGQPAARCDVRSAKFHYPVHPGDRLTLDWAEAEAGIIGFTCSTRPPERRVVTGTLRLRAR